MDIKSHKTSQAETDNAAQPMIASSKNRSVKKLFLQRGLIVTGILLFAGFGTALLTQTFAAPKPTAPGQSKKGGGGGSTPAPTPTPLPGAPIATNLSFNQLTAHPYASKAGFKVGTTNYYTKKVICLPKSSTEIADNWMIFKDNDGDGFCPVGQTLTDMAITPAGELVAGYGDWSANLDSFGGPESRVGIVPYNVNTGQWGQIVYAGSEALDVIREINGSLYAPSTDPSDRPPTGETVGGKAGFVTNEGGSWHFVNANPQNGATHVLDIGTSNGTDRLLAGSNENPAKAVVWRSVDGKTNWNESITQTSSPTPTPYDRYYWISRTGNNAVVNARLSSTTEGNYRIFNGTLWQKGATPLCSSDTMTPKKVVSFGGQVVCQMTPDQTVSPLCANYQPTSYNTSFCSFDGTTTRYASINNYIGYNNSERTSDYYIYNGYLYLMTVGGNVYRGNSLDPSTWKYLGKFDTTKGVANTIAVYNDYIYVGSANGKIFKSAIPISQIR